jgi:hypothetical protein
MGWRFSVVILSVLAQATFAGCGRVGAGGTRPSGSTTELDPQLPLPEFSDAGQIEGAGWDSTNEAGGFEVLAEFPPVAMEDVSPSSGYLGRVGDGFFFRSTAGQLLSAPISGGPRTVVAEGVPPDSLLAGDARGVYWVTPACELFRPKAQRLGVCVGRPRFAAADSTTVYVFAVQLGPGSKMEENLWAIPRAGGAARKLGNVADRTDYTGTIFDGERFYYQAATGTVVALSRSGEAVPFARERPNYRISSLQFADSAALYWTSQSSKTSLEEEQLVRVDKRGGTPKILGNVSPTVAADGNAYYWFDPSLPRLWRAPRKGGSSQLITHLPPARWELHPHGSEIIAFDGSMLVRISAAPRAPRRVHQQETSIEYLTGAGDALYFVAGLVDERTREPTNELWTLPKTGGEPRRIGRQSFWSAPVVDGDFAYFRGKEGIVQRVRLDAGKTQTLVEPRSLGRFPRNEKLKGMETMASSTHLLDVDGSHVYFADPERGVVLRVPKAGGPMTVVARDTESVTALKVDATHVYLATSSPGPPTSEPTKPRLLRVPKSGRARPSVLSVLESEATALAVDGSHVFWVGDRVLSWIEKTSGGGSEQLHGDVCSFDFALHEGSVVFTWCGFEGMVWRLRLQDRKLTALATGLMSPMFPVADSRAVHWVTVGQDIHPMSSIVGCCAIWASDL